MLLLLLVGGRRLVGLVGVALDAVALVGARGHVRSRLRQLGLALGLALGLGLGLGLGFGFGFGIGLGFGSGFGLANPNRGGRPHLRLRPPDAVVHRGVQGGRLCRS